MAVEDEAEQSTKSALPLDERRGSLRSSDQQSANGKGSITSLRANVGDFSSAPESRHLLAPQYLTQGANLRHGAW